MKKQKILFIIRSYPPIQSANVLCDEKIMLALLKTNQYEIHALTCRYNRQPPKELVNRVQVHRFSRGPLWDLYTWARHQKSSWKTQCIFKFSRLVLRFQQFITSPIYPFTELWAIWLYTHHASKLHCKEHFDLVIAEHNGLDTLMAGYLLKKKSPQVKFMPIFWDPLSGGIDPKYLSKTFSRRRRVQTEREIFQRVDRAIIMQTHFPLLKQIYGNTPLLQKIRALDLPSFGTPPSSISSHSIFTFNKDKIYLCFAGSLSNRHIELLSEQLNKTGLKNIELLAICGNEVQPRIQALARKVSFPIHFLSYMPHEELLQFLCHMNIFINLGVQSNTMVASKIFEYMSFGKPVISTYQKEDDANLFYLQKYPLSFLLDERKAADPTQIAQLRAFIEQNANKYVPYEQIASLFYANTPQAYVEEINNLLEDA